MPWWLLVSTILGVLLFGQGMSDSSRLLAIETLLFLQLMDMNSDAVDKMGCLVKILYVLSMMAWVCYLWWFWIRWMTVMWHL